MIRSGVLPANTRVVGNRCHALFVVDSASDRAVGAGFTSVTLLESTQWPPHPENHRPSSRQISGSQKEFLKTQESRPSRRQFCDSNQYITASKGCADAVGRANDDLAPLNEMAMDGRASVARQLTSFSLLPGMGARSLQHFTSAATTTRHFSSSKSMTTSVSASRSR